MEIEFPKKIDLSELDGAGDDLLSLATQYGTRYSSLRFALERIETYTRKAIGATSWTEDEVACATLFLDKELRSERVEVSLHIVDACCRLREYGESHETLAWEQLHALVLWLNRADATRLHGADRARAEQAFRAAGARANARPAEHRRWQAEADRLRTTGIFKGHSKSALAKLVKRNLKLREETDTIRKRIR